MTIITHRREFAAIGLGLAIVLAVGPALAQAPRLGATLTTRDGGQIFAERIERLKALSRTLERDMPPLEF
jgi:hypothetical protein